MTERRQGTDVTVFFRFLLRKSFFPSNGTHRLTQRNYPIPHFPALFFLRRGERWAFDLPSSTSQLQSNSLLCFLNMEDESHPWLWLCGHYTRMQNSRNVCHFFSVFCIFMCYRLHRADHPPAKPSQPDQQPRWRFLLRQIKGLIVVWWNLKTSFGFSMCLYS